MFDRPHSDVNPVIARRRELEDKRATLQATLEKNNKLSHVATWENRNEHVFIRSQVKQAAIAARKAAEDNLANRRSRLARLIADDEAVFKQEIIALQETPEQKAARMSARAREIKAAKEAKRQEVAEDAYYRQWRAQTDELRTLDSQKALDTAARGRKEQLEQMRLEKEKAKLDEQRWAAQWDAERQKKEQREQADALRAQAFNSKTREGLDYQLRELSARKEQERAQRMAEMEALERHMAAEAEAQREAERKKLEDAHRKNRELTEFNAALQARKDAEARQKAAEDLAFLQNDIDLHRQETQQMLDEKMRLRVESEAYRAFLAERRANEAAMERELERLIQQELDRVNLEQDRKRTKEDEARQQLMKEVQVERQRQLQAQELGKSLERHVKLQERQAVDSDVQRYLEEQHARESARKRNEEQRRIEIERQIFNAPNRHEQRQAMVREEQALERQAAGQQSLMWEKEKQREASASRSDSRRGNGTFGRKGANWYS